MFVLYSVTAGIIECSEQWQSDVCFFKSSNAKHKSVYGQSRGLLCEKITIF